MYFAVLVCSASTACNVREDPVAGQKWRLSASMPAAAETDCNRAIDSREKALALLPVAKKECLDKVIDAVATYAKDDLPAAYAIRAERNDDPVDYVHALDAALSSDGDVVRFNRALLQQELLLTREALASWDEVVKRDPSELWKEQARRRRDQLRNSGPRWNPAELSNALQRRDVPKIRAIATEYPTAAVEYVEDSGLRDLEGLKMLADALAATGDLYARDIVQAAMTAKDRSALEEGLRAMAEKRYERAASLLERAGNPLHLTARYRLAAEVFLADNSLPILDSISPITEKRRYRDLQARIHTLRANALEFDDDYFEALSDYERALESTTSATRIVDARSRRSLNYATIGKSGEAFREAFAALRLLPQVANLNARHHAYASAANAARTLEYPAVALQFQNAAVEMLRQEAVAARGDRQAEAKHHLAIALRLRADIRVQLRQEPAAQVDLKEASELAEAARPNLVPLLRMRLAEVSGQHALLRGQTRQAVSNFTEAINVAGSQDSTYRAVLHYKRAMAQPNTPAAEKDLAAALAFLRTEGTRLREHARRGAYESLWSAYFSRFQEMHHQLIDSRLARNDPAGAFVHAERARAFEPMQLLLQSGPMPPGFYRIETTADLQRALAELPDDTLILQYLVLENRTYSWALSRGNIQPASHRAGRAQIQRWVDDVQTSVKAGKDGPLITAMRAAYAELFSVHLSGSRPARIVIVPDGPMLGLPFAALQSTNRRYVLEDSSIAVAGSTSLYLYALQRDKEFRPASRPSVLIVGEPKILPQFDLGPLPNALEEARQLHSDYPGSELLTEAGATTDRFLESAKDAAIIHFAGHAVANPQDPWLSMLVLAPDGNDYGDLTAQKLLTRLPDLGRTRLIVLAACSTASGRSVGSEGLAPLVRPLVAARVPAIVGTSWDVKDTATIKDLLVSFHRHYRNGADVAVALQQAQLGMLRKKQPARQWAPLQAVGYAASPYAHHAAQERKPSEHLRIANPLHRPDGLHPQ